MPALELALRAAAMAQILFLAVLMLRQRGLRLERADSAAMPFAEGCFDRVLAVHTLYFWADPA